MTIIIHSKSVFIKYSVNGDASFVMTVLNHSGGHGAMLTYPKHHLSKVVKLVVVHDQTLVDERGKHRHIGVNP